MTVTRFPAWRQLPAARARIEPMTEQRWSRMPWHARQEYLRVLTNRTTEELATLCEAWAKLDDVLDTARRLGLNLGEVDTALVRPPEVPAPPTRLVAHRLHQADHAEVFAAAVAWLDKLGPDPDADDHRDLLRSVVESRPPASTLRSAS